jgi:hypothetical protein
MVTRAADHACLLFDDSFHRIPDLLPPRQPVFQYKDTREPTLYGDTRRIGTSSSGVAAAVEYQLGVLLNLGQLRVLLHL